MIRIDDKVFRKDDVKLFYLTSPNKRYVNDCWAIKLELYNGDSIRICRTHENDIRSLDAINTRVIFLDVAKQNTDNGLAYTLFSNFLKNLGFRSDLYGYMEYELFIDDKYEFLEEKLDKAFEESKTPKNEYVDGGSISEIY